mmetsp:Transcript_43919/g.70607  ORF Transcript_43919/g.70607 Transcript_43919/m.70607 type:complete len:154 (-) Transcript_43919:48-509(-)|eukprot:jgi/Bigna1/91579/estExt_fgenesh1_pg.C_1070045
MSKLGMSMSEVKAEDSHRGSFTEEELFKAARGWEGFNVKQMRQKKEFGVSFICIDSQDGNTLLHDAVINNNMEVVRFLIEESGAKLINKTNKNGRTPLHCAMVQTGDMRHEMVRYLLEHKANPDIEDADGRKSFDKAFVKRSKNCNCGLCTVM